jgi:hypothetical protein
LFLIFSEQNSLYVASEDSSREAEALGESNIGKEQNSKVLLAT